MAYFYNWTQPLNGPVVQSGDKNTPTLEGNAAHTNAFLAAAGTNYPGMANFSFDYGDAHFTCLDSNPYVDWSDPKFRTWLANDLSAASGKAWRFVAFHHPGFHSSDKHQTDKQMRKVADLFEAGKVDVVFSGHVHNYQRTYPIKVGAKAGASVEELNKDDWSIDTTYNGTTHTKPKGIVYIVDGGGGNALYDTKMNGHREMWKPFQANYISEFCFSLVSITKNRFELRQVDKDGKEIDRIAIDK